jgi:hypothetical protein
VKLKIFIAFFVPWAILCAVVSGSAFANASDEAELKAEKDLISSSKKKIKREKDQLTLTLKNKKKKSFKDNLEEGSEKYIRHVLVDYIAKHEVAIIQEHFYEGGQFVIVSLKDGSQLITPTKPTWSPDKTNFISINDDESDYTENKTVIGTCKKMKCTKLFTEETHAGNEKWIDDKTVEFEKRKFDANTGNSEVSNYVCKIEKKVTCSPKQ